MTLLVGALLGAGLLLCVSPWLWPRQERPARDPRSTRLRRLLDEAGHSRTPTRTIVAVMVAIAAVSAALAWLLTGIPVLVSLAALAGAAAPVMFLRGRRLRLRKARRQM